MDRQELERYLHISRSHSVVIDVTEVVGAPGILKIVTVHQGNSVSIEFEKARAYVEGDMEGGGLKYVARYPDMDVLIQDLEEYLDRPLEECRNFTAEPLVPPVLDEPDPVRNMEYLEGLVRQQLVRLPRRGQYQLAGVYWRHIAKYGTYRPDKLLEEQDEHLALSKNG